MKNTPRDVDATGQKSEEKPWRTLQDQPFCVATKLQTHQKHDVSEISDTREKNDHNNKHNPFERQICKIGHDAVSLCLPPVSVPNQKQPKPVRKFIS